MAKEQQVVLAFDVGGTRIKAGLIQESRVLASVIVPTRGEQVVATLLQIGRELSKSQQVQAVGMCIKGIVDSKSGCVVDVNESLQCLQGLPLADLLTEAFKVPVFLENDARLYTWGEFLYGAGRGYDNLLCLTLGTGVGCGVVFDGQLLRGKHGTRGIFGGHVSIQSDGERCTCGNIGCLEMFIGANGWIRRIERDLSGQISALRKIPLDPPQVCAAAAAGDAFAQAAVQQFMHDLATGIVTLIHVYDPDGVVIGGGLAAAVEQFLPAVQSAVNERAWTLPRARVPILVAQQGDVAALLGAAELAWGRITFL
ncbi:MAG: ROK family protein [Ktedonobacteraceae bacterium]